MTAPAAGMRDRRTPLRERHRILRSRNRFWRLEEIAGARSTTKHFLADLVANGELRRVRRGLYWRGTRSPLGLGFPPTHALIRELAPGPGVGPAGLYAANLLRLSTQVPRQAQIAVPARAPQSTGSVRFVARAARTGRRKAGLTPTEVALLEVLGSWERSIEVPPAEAWTRLQDLLTSGRARSERITRAAKTESGTVRARLCELLRAVGRSDLAAMVPEPDARTTVDALRVLRIAL
ncbi:MAG: hypothetical protein M3N95_05775 [Actinomycetota bacterium]|nr:hypothetical protein [Actinomycetota bacterium]